MPQVIATTQDRGLDAEIDALWKKIAELEARIKELEEES